MSFYLPNMVRRQTVGLTILTQAITSTPSNLPLEDIAMRELPCE